MSCVHQNNNHPYQGAIIVKAVTLDSLPPDDRRLQDGRANPALSLEPQGRGLSFRATINQTSETRVTRGNRQLLRMTIVSGLSGNVFPWDLFRLGIGVCVIGSSGVMAQTLIPIGLRVWGRKRPPHLNLALSQLEWLAIAQLLIIGFCALPILPNQAMGPWNAVNPRTVGYLILFIAGISFVGHFAMRIFGNRFGLLATAAIGGLVSSTAVTLSFARRAQKDKQNVAILGAGISLAAAIMAIRVILEVGVVNASLLPLLLPGLLCLGIFPFIAAIAIALKIKPKPFSDNLDLENPLELGSAIFFGLILALLSILVRATEAWFGDGGVYLLSVLSGITDVDALSLSLAEATQRSLSPRVGAIGIFLGASINTVVKGIMATAIGGVSLARWCASILFGSLMLGAIAMVISLWWVRG